MSKERKKRPRHSSLARQDDARREPAWQLQTAKARFSELFRRARTEGPQFITRQGKERVVMISDEQYGQLARKARQARSIVQFFRESPLVGLHLKLDRQKDEPRDVRL
ncbi:MAG TPA: type II toxin-antitoxin system prevent-host-death family antitoxin [Candidatus Acidoferrales bacterium]|nr:type II toxin-antitoxin system prevent-host-death family antitoxin [Candidatus Acidoferrales bacterium]